MRFSVYGLICALALGGCASVPEIHYYTLDMTPTDAPGRNFNVEVDRFRPSEPVSKPEIMIAKSPTEIEYYAADTWVANVGVLIEEKLQAEFGHGVAAQNTYIISGDVIRFGQIDTPGGADAHVKLEVTVTTPGAARSADPLLKKVYEVKAPAASAGVGDVVLALSESLEVIAADIAVDIERLE